MVMLIALVFAGCAAAQKPAVLIVCPHLGSSNWADLNYLAELHEAGFEVGYTDTNADFTWDRAKQYNVLVIYSVPPEQEARVYEGRLHYAGQPDKQEYLEIVNRFLQASGGVLVMARVSNAVDPLVGDLIRPWGADIPLEIVEDPENTASMTRMPSVKLVYTNQIFDSPVSEGVNAFWFPHGQHYDGGNSLPIWVDDNWQIVARAMPSATTVPIQLSPDVGEPGPGAILRPEGVPEPPLFAIREYQNGRIAFCAQWPQWSLAQGTKWLYNREVLERGLQGKPSDFGRLLQNTFRWLAEPSLASGTLGGFVTDPMRLVAENLRPGAKEQFEEVFWSEEEEALHRPPANRTLYRGLIGAQSSLSGGQGSVADYAAAAKQAGLDFVAFLEDFRQFDAAKLAQLKDACQRYSDDELVLYPGYWVTSNVGNKLFFFGPDPELPPDFLRVGEDKKIFELQHQNEQGEFEVGPLSNEWVLGRGRRQSQIGYFDFAASPNGQRLQDCRLYAMAALNTYRDGELVEDLLNDYLETAQCTIAPSPCSVNLVSSPQALIDDVNSGHALTYGQARSLDTLFQDALRWAGQYGGVNVFLSDGPSILRWPACARAMIFGAELFVTGRSLMRTPIYVTSEVGLREIRIYNGRDLFRRLKLNGEKVFEKLLYFPATVHRNLVLVVEDMQGGQAVSSTRRSWKSGQLAPVFCGDYANDCGFMFLAHGPYSSTVSRTPEIADPGYTWDGGPKGTLSPIVFQGSDPYLL